MRSDFDNWMKFRVSDLKLLLKDAPFEWYLAGGYALDEFMKKRTREHDDIDILLDIKYIKEVLGFFKQYQIFIARDGNLLENKNNILSSDSLWISKDKFSPFFLEIMLFESKDGDWIYKRNRDIRRPIDSFYFISNEIKVIEPEIQLLYKMNSNNVRNKDLLDYENVYSKLSEEQRIWLDKILNN
ncbi:nucleotidyltransferase domain-containing protein [Macrococcus equi]|uniref:nucleotidyltransferase domain-containing protein n=1 Tax=Macrococcus equi TaxID=3395462 RepID=UPI0039BE5B8F